MTDNKAIKEIRNKIKEIMNSYIDKYDVRGKLDSNGAIFYRNGNDGTDFDWKVNGRTCEFFTFFGEKPKMGFCKITVECDGYIRIWVYLNGERESAEQKEVFIGEDKAKLFAVYLYFNADNRGIWDETIDHIDFGNQLTEENISDFNFLMEDN